MEIISDDPSKKKKRKHKSKHKKHTTQKAEKEKTRKHKKHKRKHSISTSDTEVPKPKPKDEEIKRYTPELTPKKILNGETHKISTDPTSLVENITAGLVKSQSQVPDVSLEVISSESEPEQIDDYDSDDIDVRIIEDDMNLEELMQQKARLQAVLGEFGEDETGAKTPAVAPQEIINIEDDSSNDALPKPKRRERERVTKVVVKRRPRPQSPYERERSPYRYQRGSRARSIEDRRRERPRSRSRHNRDNRDYRMRRPDSRDRNNRSYRDRERDQRDRHHRYRRDNQREHQRMEEKKDKYKDSLSEGLALTKEDSSDSDVIEDIDIKEEEDEEQIIERRRKQREELLKVSLNKNLRYWRLIF